MLFFTNRTVVPAATDHTAFSAAFLPMDDKLSRATVDGTYDKKGRPSWALTDVKAHDDDAGIVEALVEVFRGKKPVLLYLHGNNNTPAHAFNRCHMLQTLYGVNVIGFSWTSEGLQPDGSDLSGLVAAKAVEDEDEDAMASVKPGNASEGWVHAKIRRYRQAKANAQDSTPALARFLRLVAVARLYGNNQKLTVAVHSLGCHFLQKAIELDGVQQGLASATNVLLLAACTSNEKHASWAGKINPMGQLFIAFNNGDSVLLGASVADSGDIKLGARPGPDRVQSAKVRYIDFEGSGTGLGGHGYFAASWGKKPRKAAYKLFGKLFCASRDFEPNESPKKAYSVGCNEARTECYMGSYGEPD